MRTLRANVSPPTTHPAHVNQAVPFDDFTTAGRVPAARVAREAEIRAGVGVALDGHWIYPCWRSCSSVQPC